MSARTYIFVLFVLVLLIGTFCLLAARSAQRQPMRAEFLCLTNGTIGTMTSSYSAFSSNHSFVVQRWINQGTNTALLRVVNDGSAGVWLFPIARIENQKTNKEALLLNASTFSGILLPAHRGTNVEVAIFESPSEMWRVRIDYTRDTSEDSILRRLTRLPRELTATLWHQPLVEQTTPIKTDWIQLPE